MVVIDKIKGFLTPFSAPAFRISCSSVCILLITGAGIAHGDELFHSTKPIFACVNPRATKALANQDDPRLNDPKWVQFVVKDGRCFQVSPGDAWEQISDRDGMKLLRRSPPVAGTPPLYFMPSDVTSGAPFKITDEQPTEDASSPDPAAQNDNSAVFPDAAAPPESGDSRHDSGDQTPSGIRAPEEAPVADPPPPQNVSAQAVPQTTDTGRGGLFGFVCIGVIAFVALGVWKKVAAKKKLGAAWNIVLSEIDRQANALQIRKLQLATPDHYGTVNLSRWQKEINYFCESRLQTLLSGAGLSDQWPLISGHAAQRVDDVASAAPASSTIPPRFVSDPRTFDPRMDPIDYERHCALLLQEAGWDARVTQASGDQGADVIAERRGQKIVVQCKLYSQPVGNKAVQEAFAAKQHQGADMALVATNADFTPSARQLASTTGVILVHHSQLGQFRL